MVFWKGMYNRLMDAENREQARAMIQQVRTIMIITCSMKITHRMLIIV
jgi:hypothetical protein